MRRLPYLILCVLLSSILVGCEQDVKNVVHKETDPNKMPTVISRDVYTLISDSGVTRYRIKSPLWNIFEEARRPYWNFPKGLVLEQLNQLNFSTEASVECGYAVYYKDKQLWKLEKNVVVRNILKDTMWTQQLYWDQEKKEIYSDSFIHINKSQRIIEGTGFRSNENFTQYEIKHVSGIFPMKNPGAGVGGVPQAPSDTMRSSRRDTQK